jgi:NTP pyrophosphatase (non-canonical NTP hydrolase)
VAETQKKINQWGLETFGPCTPIEIAIRANVEMAELLSAVSNGALGSEISEEAADVAVILLQATARWDITVELPPRDFKPEVDPNTASIDVAAMAALQLAAAIQEVLSFGAPEQLTYRMASVFNCLVMLASRHGRGLSMEVDEKMRINRARTWERTKGGRFQHTEGTR